MSTSPVGPSLTPGIANSIAVNLFRATPGPIKKTLQLPSVTVVPASTPTLNVQLINVGVLRGVWVKCVATIANADGALTASLSDFGPANMWSQIVYNDLSNITRIQTTGAHLFMGDCIRRRGIFGAAYTNDNPGKFGANWTPIKAPATIANGASGVVISYHYIPVQYSDNLQSLDFRGAVFCNVSNANQSISLTFNPNVSVAAGVDSVNALYGGVTTPNVSITSATVTVYQDVWDQLPTWSQLPAGVTPAMWIAATGDSTGLVVPNAAMKFMYEWKFTSFANLSPSIENVFPYTNQRQYLSTILQYNNPARALGTDINYIRLAAANSYEYWKYDPLTVALKTRQLLHDDFPAGFYLFESRDRPINTSVSGNLQLSVNPITASAGANANIFYEDFALTSTVTGATSLASGN